MKLMNTLMFFTLSASFVASYKIPIANVDILIPKGFRLSLPHEEGLSQISFNIKINNPINLYQPGDFAAIITEQTGDIWAYDNINTLVKIGDNINYWVHVQFSDNKNFREVGTVMVSKNTRNTVNMCAAAAEEVKKCKPIKDCVQSETTVNGEHMCKDELLFEDNFDKLDSTKWNHEIRIPQSSDDYQFVVFMDKLKNCHVSDGKLNIMPSLSTDILGNEKEQIRNGIFNLGELCTAYIDRSRECKRKAQYYQILPPIVSAKINTKHNFSFRYGKVEIRAKLPRGDWMFPLILLEPLENYYGIGNYMSGQVRIAYNRGNKNLLDADAVDISNSALYSSIVMSNVEKHRKMINYNYHLYLDSKFYVYTMTWTKDYFEMAVDGRVYAKIEEDFSKTLKNLHGIGRTNSKMAPFDREFYLSLGVSVGGHCDFPDDIHSNGQPKPWKNRDPKAELRFWEDASNWSKTWQSGLEVDYIRVYAL